MSRPSRTTCTSCAWLLLSAIGLGVHGQVARAQTATTAVIAIAEDGVDIGVEPGDDFFAYANGEWLRSTQIPASKGRWGARNQIAETATQQLALVIREADGPAGSPGRKVADFRAAYLDEARIEKKGLAPIAPLPKSVDRLRDKSALARWLGGHLQADADPMNLGVFDASQLFGVAASYGIHGEPNYVAYLVQGGLGLTDRNAYLDDSVANQALRVLYRDHIARMLQQAGFSSATQRADAVLALEIAIARSHANAVDSAKESNADHRWHRADFARQAPGLDWPAFFASAGLSKQAAIVVWQPAAIKGSAALVASQPLPVWKDYLRFHIVDRYADVLPRSIAEPARAFRATLAAAPAPVPREQRAIDATNQALPEAVGRLCVERYFPAASKARAQSILDHVVAAFGRRVGAVPWMTATAKSVALTKLKGMYFGLGYPEQWQDDSTLVIDAHDAAGNRRRVADWLPPCLGHAGAARRSARVEPGAANAGRHPEFPARLAHLRGRAAAAAPVRPRRVGCRELQRPWRHPRARNQPLRRHPGRRVRRAGRDAPRWTAEDKTKHDAAAQALVDQYSAYRPFPDLGVDGKLNLVENIADLGGLAAAFDAHREALGSRAADPVELRRQDRQFFIAFARAWRPGQRLYGTRGARSHLVTGDQASYLNDRETRAR